jgi:predicted SAM-dependent methyltransferase
MTWSLENSKNDESAKVRWELVPYMRGRCLDLGCGPYKVFPHFIGVDNGHHWGHMGTDVRVDTAEKLDLFADESCDLTYSSHLLEHIHYENVPATLKEWMRVTKKGGHMILYLPAEGDYPSVGHPHANPDHKWNVSYDLVVGAMEKVPCDWDMVDFQERHEADEYSLLFVFKKL